MQKAETKYQKAIKKAKEKLKYIQILHFKQHKNDLTDSLTFSILVSFLISLTPFS